MKTKTGTRIMIMLVTVIVIISGCKNSTPDNTQITNKENEKLSMNIHDSCEARYMAIVDEIDWALNQIRDTKGSIILGPESNVERDIPTETRIFRNISILSDVLKDNKAKVDVLNRKIRLLENQHKKLTQLTADTDVEVKKKEEEINFLKERVIVLNEKIAMIQDTLGGYMYSNSVLKSVIDGLDEEQNTVYYITGSYADLKEKNVVEKTKGILGLGRSRILSKKVDKDLLEKGDLRKVNEINLATKNSNIITPHPEQSYKIVKDENGVEYLKITDAKVFWSISKYLVVET